MWSSMEEIPNQVSKNPYMRLKILTYESGTRVPCKVKKPIEILMAD